MLTSVRPCTQLAIQGRNTQSTIQTYRQENSQERNKNGTVCGPSSGIDFFIFCVFRPAHAASRRIIVWNKVLAMLITGARRALTRHPPLRSGALLTYGAWPKLLLAGYLSKREAAFSGAAAKFQNGVVSGSLLQPSASSALFSVCGSGTLLLLAAPVSPKALSASRVPTLFPPQQLKTPGACCTSLPSCSTSSLLRPWQPWKASSIEEQRAVQSGRSFTPCGCR
eukprot:3882472-Pleurochrysis_carterae.AAC.3